MSNPIKSSIPVLRLAISSRILILTLIILFRLLFDPYDTSSSLNPPCLSNSSTPSNRIRWTKVAASIESSIVWDGVHFVRIAECGYEYEHTYAFLPLFPICMVLIAKSVFAPLVPLIGYRAVLALSGYVLNNVAFVVAAYFLYRLSVIILKDYAASYQACLLFCFNPASIFYSSVYSESLYALTSFGGLFYLFSGANNTAMILLSLSGAARSNGAINAGYFCFLAILKVYNAVLQKERSRQVLFVIFAAIARSLFIFTPFILFQAYGYVYICHGDASYELRPWCRARVPLLYSFLQSHYWGVGFLRYFQVKQLPNFLLASPTLSLAVCSIIWYARSLPKVLMPFKEERTFASVLNLDGVIQNADSTSESNHRISASNFKGDGMVRQRKRGGQEQDSHHARQEALHELNKGYHSIMVLPFILHLVFMTFTAFFVMHVQVSTRFLSASPPIYWFASYLMQSPGSTSKRLGYLICVYFIGYILIGCLLFSNFYPFT